MLTIAAVMMIGGVLLLAQGVWTAFSSASAGAVMIVGGGLFIGLSAVISLLVDVRELLSDGEEHE